MGGMERICGIICGEITSTSHIVLSDIVNRYICSPRCIILYMYVCTHIHTYIFLPLLFNCKQLPDHHPLDVAVDLEIVVDSITLCWLLVDAVSWADSTFTYTHADVDTMYLYIVI